MSLCNFDAANGNVEVEGIDPDLLRLYYLWLNNAIVQNLTEINEQINSPYQIHVVASEPYTKKMKNGSKTPLEIMNDLKPGLQYNIVSSNEPGLGTHFQASVEIDGTIYTGRGNSKQRAKHSAAEAALIMLCPSEITPADRMDFSQGMQERAATPPKKLKQKDLVEKALNGQVNPVYALNIIFSNLEYECVSKFSPFVCKVVVDGICYEGSGNSKKAAKAAAARNALLLKFGAEFSSRAKNDTFLPGGFPDSGMM